MTTILSSSRPHARASEDGSSPVFPLDDFYARAGMPLPRFELIPGEAMPEPYRSLLVHERDMTSTLEDYHGGELHIEVLSRRRRGHAYFREVILRLDRGDRPVEFGAIRMSLDRFEPDVQQLILAEHLPLGHILKVLRVPHYGRPHAFFRVHSDDLMNRAFLLSEAAVLYGRRNTLCDPEGRAFSQIVEILPPA